MQECNVPVCKPVDLGSVSLSRDRDTAHTAGCFLVEQAALTDTPEWLKGVAQQKQIWTIATMNKGETAMLIAGDDARNKFMVLPGGGYITIEIRLPENWDELLAPLGYEPLARFALAEE